MRAFVSNTPYNEVNGNLKVRYIGEGERSIYVPPNGVIARQNGRDWKLQKWRPFRQTRAQSLNSVQDLTRGQSKKAFPY